MGTRGAWGFIKDGVEKVTYNHYDSDPPYLGKSVVEFIQTCEKEKEDFQKLFSKIKLVDISKTPTKKEIERGVKLGLTIDTDKPDWYWFLHDMQDDLHILRKVKRMIDNKTFLEDSLFCEYAYIINLDTNMLEIYQGFNKDPEAPGRYAKRRGSENREYYGVALKDEIPLDTIKTTEIDALVERMEKACS